MKTLVSLLLISLFRFAPAAHASGTPIYVDFRHHNDFTGNDFGYTGGLNLEVGKIEDDGWQYAIGFYSALYSQRVIPYGNPQNPSYQVFTDYQHLPKNSIQVPNGTQDQRIEQNSIGYLKLAHTPKDAILSWSVQGGITQTECNHGYIPGLAGWQAALHHLISATTYDIVADGKPTEYGLVIMPKLNADFKLVEGARFDFDFTPNLAASGDSEGRREFLSAQLGFKMSVFPSKMTSGKVLQWESNVEGQTSPLHKQVTLTNEFRLNFAESSIFGGVTYLLTDTGYAEYFETNYVDNDPIYRLGFTLWWGK